MVASLLSGFIERSGFPQVAVFLAIGAALGPYGLGLLNAGLDSELLRSVATLSLVMVLFTDAVKLDLSEVRRQIKLTGLILGPGVVILALTIAALAFALLGLSWPAALIVGAALASTDPVLLRPLLVRRDVPDAVRLGLKLETGLGDIILLPVVIIAMEFVNHDGMTGGDLAHVLVNLFLLGPVAGVLVGVAAIGALEVVRRRVGIRRDYESLYSLGVALAAYAAAESVHGSGFVAAFVAGLTISALDVELCDCFVEYGETTAELALLLAFVVLGASLIWLGLPLALGVPLLFAVLIVFARPLIFAVALLPANIASRSRRTIGWFGPSGLSSLLLALLPVFSRIPGSDYIFSICALAVVISIVVHGGTLMFYRGEPPEKQKRSRPAGELLPMYQDSPLTAAPPGNIAAASDSGEHPTVEDGTRISIDEVKTLLERGEQVVFLDVRTERSFNNSEGAARGAVRMPPDHTAERASELGLDQRTWIAAYCT